MMEDSPRGGIVQNDKETVALLPEIKFGLMTPESMERMAQVARKYNIPGIKITSAQRIALVGVKPEDVEAVWTELDMIPGHGLGTGINYIKACPGTGFCRLGQRDSLALGEKLYAAVMPLGVEAKVKFGISGCPLSCSEGAIRDIGIFGKKATGWTIQIGGNSGMNACIGQVLAKDLEDDQVIDLCVRLLTYYKENMRKKERMYRFVPRVGFEQIKKDLGLE